MSEDNNQSFSMSSFWKTNLPTRNLLIIIVVTHIVLWIISLSKGNITTFRDAISISNDLLIVVGQFNLAVFHGYVYQLFTSIFVHALTFKLLILTYFWSKS